MSNVNNFESGLLVLREKKEILKAETDDKLFLSKLKDFNNEFTKLFEALIFDLLSSSDDFYGNFLVNISRKFNYGINSYTNHQIVGLDTVIHINPFHFINLNREEMKFFLKHELYHIINLHIERTKDFVGVYPNKLIIYACDLMANQTLIKDSVEVPKTVTIFTVDKFNETYNEKLDCELSLEDMVKELYQIYKNNDKFNAFISEGCKDEKNLDFEQIESTIFDEELTKEELEFLSDFSIKFSDYSSISLLEDFIRKVTVDSFNNSRGYLPSGLKGLIAYLNRQPKIQWQSILKRKLGSIPVPYKKTPFRFDRRQPRRTDIKGKLSNHVVKIYVGIDTSGSVSDEEINYVLSEINAIGKDYNADIQVIECDAVIQREYTLKKGSRPDGAIEGRGGTYFTPVIERVNEDPNNFKIVIYFTDGEGESEIPTLQGGNIIWVLTRDNSISVKNPQGQVLKLSDDQKYKKQIKNY